MENDQENPTMTEKSKKKLKKSPQVTEKRHNQMIRKKRRYLNKIENNEK